MNTDLIYFHLLFEQEVQKSISKISTVANFNILVALNIISYNLESCRDNQYLHKIQIPRNLHRVKKFILFSQTILYKIIRGLFMKLSNRSLSWKLEQVILVSFQSRVKRFLNIYHFQRSLNMLDIQYGNSYIHFLVTKSKFCFTCVVEVKLR